MILIIFTLHTGQNPATGFCPFLRIREGGILLGTILKALIAAAAVVLEEILDDDD